MPRSEGATRVAVVGAGFIADFHLQILRATAGVEVVAVCDHALERARSLARRYGVPRALGALEELFGIGVDVAHVLVPPDLHAGIARRLLDAGVGVLIEKPLALSSDEARSLGRLARERGLVLGVNHNSLHQPAFARLLARVRAGEIGRVEHVRVCLSVPLRQLETGDVSHWMFRQPRNILFEQAPHPFAQVCALIGAVREAHTSLLSTRELPSGQPFHERWLLAAQGQRGTLEAYLAFGQPLTRSTLEVFGSDGALEADLIRGLVSGERKTWWLDFYDSFLAGWRRGGALRRDSLRALGHYLRFTLGLGPRCDEFFVGMRDSIRAFHAALRAGAAPPAGAEAGVAVLEWCEAATRGVAPAPPQPCEPPPAGEPRPDEIVVLGASGFLGRRLVRALVERGLPVTAVVRRPHRLPAELAAPGLRLVRADLERPAELRGAVRGARCVLHLATGSGADWAAIERAMVRGSIQLAEAALLAGVRRFVFVSSTAALYLGADAGSVVEDDLPCDSRPLSRAIYARGKILAERALLDLHRERGLPLVIARPAVVLGAGAPMQHSGLGLWVRDNHCVGWGRGATPLPVVAVDDVVDALVRLTTFAGTGLEGRALNLSADTGLSARRIVEELRTATGRDLCFHARPLALSQALEIGKWLVTKVGRRPGASFPSWRDLKSRQMRPRLSSRTARELLGWAPVDDPERFLDLAVRVHARSVARPELRTPGG